MKLIKIIAQLNPFSTDKSIFEFESDTVSNLLKKLDTNKAVNTGWRVMMDDQIITNFETVVPAGSTVYIKLVPEGDSTEEAGTKVGIWTGVLTMIAGAVLLFIPGAQAFGGIALGVGCIMFTGAGYTYLDIQAKKLSDKEKPEADPSIRGSQNQARPMQQIPTLLGRRRIYPDLIMTPYTEVDSSGNQYLCQLFCAGQKDQKIDTSSIKIEETLLKDYSASKNIDTVLAGNDEHINMKIHYGNSSLSLFKKCVHEQQFNSSLKNKLEDDTSGAVIWTTPAGTTEISVDIFFYNGLAKYNDKGKIESASVTVKAYYKPKDASDSAYQLVGYFNKFPLLNSNTITNNQLKTLRYIVAKSGLPADSYTIKVERETADSDSSMVVDEVYLGSIRAIKNSAPVRSEILQKICVIELKVKATPKLQNIIEKLNFVSQSYLPIYSKSGTGSSSWETQALSSNPASVAVFAMQGAMAQQKLKASDIDWMAFEKLYNWCESHNYECNYFLSESISISQLLTNIATCARCEIFRLNGKITVVQDIERDSAVQLFTPRNSKNYTETLLKAEIPDCIALKFVNEESGFAEDEVKVYNTSTGNKITEPETTQEVSLWGVTNSKQARKVGMYDLAVFRARSVVHTFQCDFEYMLCSKGDWIKYAGDIALAGLKQGRIENLIYNDNGKIIGFKSDELLPMQEENSYAVRIRKNDGTISLYDVVYTEGNHLEILFSESLPADEIQEQNLFAFGIRGQETIDLIITSITCQDNLMAEITAVEYAPKIFEVDSPNFTLPDFESKISDVPGVVDSGALDLSDWRTFYTYNDSSEKPLKPTGNGTENGWHRNSTAQSKWMSSKTSKDVNSGEWSAPSPTGSFVFDKLLSEEPTIENPDTPEFLTAFAEENGIKISCSTKTGIKNSISKYIFEINKGSVWIQKTSESSEFFYVFDRNSDGYPEGIDFSKWRIRAKVQSVYGKESDYSSEIFVNVDTYGTWQVQQPEVIVSSNKRLISLNLTQVKRADVKQVYGAIGYKILVNRPDIDDEDFFTPATNKNPSVSELNYKNDTTEPIVVGTTYIQELPLKGQNAKKWKFKYYETRKSSTDSLKDSVSYLDNLDSVIIPDSAEKTETYIYWTKTTDDLTQHFEYSLVDMPSPEETYYRFKIVAVNLKAGNESAELIIGTYARANSASDLVDNAITQNAIAPEAVTADKIAAGTITAEQIAAKDILVKGARAGMVSTEGLIVDNSVFLASKTLPYKWIDPETGEEKTYIAKPGEFFVGNSPDVNDNRDVVDFLHYLPGVGFWLKIKNFIVKGIATIIQNVFRVKKSGAEDSESFFTVNSTDEIDEETKTPANTVKVDGQILSQSLHCPNISLKENVYGSIKLLKFDRDPRYFATNNNTLYFGTSLFSTNLYTLDSDLNNLNKVLNDGIKKRGIFFNNDKIYVYGGSWIVENNASKFCNIQQYNSDFVLEKSISASTIEIDYIYKFKEGFVLYQEYNGGVLFTSDFESFTDYYLPSFYYSLGFLVKDQKIYICYKTYDNKKYFVFSDDGVNFNRQEFDAYVSRLCFIGSSLFGLGIINNELRFYKWEESENTFVLTQSLEGLGTSSFIYDETSDKLLAMGKDLIIFDGEKITTKLFLPEIQKKLIAVTDEYYLIGNTETNEIFSVKKDDEFLPIISDDKITEQNTWSAKKISEEFEKYFPVGIILAFAIDVNPEEAIGGFWVRISDVFLLGAGNKYGGGDIGGNETVTLTENELPSHSHNMIHKHYIKNDGQVTSYNKKILALTGNKGSPSLNENVSNNYQVGADSRWSGGYTNPNSEDAYNYNSNNYRKWTDYTGKSNPFSILPPYLGVYYWKRVPVKYKLVFDANGGIGEMLSILEEPQTVIIPTNNFVREGYEFLSFNTAPDGSGTSYQSGDSIVLSENITLYAIWEQLVSIPAGTYSPGAFKNLISQFITKNGNRTVKNEFTATVNNQTITVPANAKIYYNTSYSGVEQIGFNSTSTGSLGSSFETYKHYIIYVEQSHELSGMQNYVNCPITIGDVIFN